MKKQILIICTLLLSYHTAAAYTIVDINDPNTWTYTQMKQYIGQTVQFSCPMYVTNSANSLTISPRRIFTPTNQAIPLSDEYNALLNANAYATITLSNVGGDHRTGERIHDLVVKVTSQNYVEFISGTWRGNSRAELQKGYNLQHICMRGEPSIIVCTINLEYYLVDNLGTGYGPDSYNQHQKQRTKVSNALANIDADIYGFVEIEQGQNALKELAEDLSINTGRPFTYIDDGGSAHGSYTKAGFVYCTDIVEPYGKLRENNEGVQQRKKTQAFIERATGEKFLLSINHFKAKSGKGYGDNADQGDGQGTFNGDRVREAKSVINHYYNDSKYYDDPDILIMGDLNAYAMEDPITTLRDAGMIDLHRAFHADSSYSYVYRAQAGYLDHALCNSTLYPQVTGMLAYHINSDENDKYTYDKSNDQTMFRCSDHDPIIVGLKLDSTNTHIPDIIVKQAEIKYKHCTPYIYNANGGYYIIYRLDGHTCLQQSVTSEEQAIPTLRQGLYIINIYANGHCTQTKLIIP